MTRRLALVALWLLAGHLAALGVFWMLLQVPESSWLTLVGSALLALAVTLVIAAVQAGAVGAWNLAMPFGRGLVAGTRRCWSSLLAAAVFLVIWWLTALLLEWHATIRGQMDAAAIARTGSPDTGWMHAAVFGVAQFIRWTLGLSFAITLLGWLVRPGDETARQGSWLRAALHPRRWLRITLWFVLLVVLPWWQIYWRPAGLSLALEPWFVAVKLTLIAVLMSTGWALVLREGQRLQVGRGQT